MAEYVVTVDYGDEIVEYEGDLFANNERHVVLDTSTGRVWIEKAETQGIEFTRPMDDHQAPEGSEGDWSIMFNPEEMHDFPDESEMFRGA